MTSPGGTNEVGRVSIRVLPDTGGFRDRLRAALEGAEAGLEVTIPVDFDVDPEKLRAKLEAIQGRVTIPVDLEPDIAGLVAQLEALDRSKITIPVDLDAAAGIERVRAQLETLDGEKLQIKVSVTGATRGINMLLALEEIIDRLDGRNVRISIDVDGLGAALAQLGAINAATSDLGSSLSSAGSQGSQAFGRMNRGLTNVVQGLAMAVVIAPALAVAGAAITAAWGAVATAIAAVPAALFLVAAPLGAVMLGLDGIKKAAATIAPEFDKMKAAVSGTFEQGFLPVFQKLATTFPTLTSGMQETAAAITGIAARLADMVASEAGLGRLRSIFDNVNDALVKMTPGIAAAVDGLLIMGSQSGAFDALASAVNTFGNEFRASVIDLVGSGTLESAMTGLRGMLDELTRGFVQLVDNGIRTFAAAAPGVNKFLSSLTGFFERFNWDSLGTSVGKVFSGLAESLDQVDTATFREIEAAFGRLGDLFQDEEFQADLKEMIEGIPAAVDQIRELSRAFAEIGSTFSGMLQSFNAVDTGFQEFIDSFYGTAVTGREKIAEALGTDKNDPIGLRSLEDMVEALGLGDFLSLYFAAAMQAGATAINSGLLLMQTSMQLGWDQIGLITSTAWQLIPSYVTLGMTVLTQSLTTGMELAKIAWQLAWDQIGLIVSAAWQLIPTYISLGMTVLTQTLTTGMEGAKIAWQLAWDQIGLIVSTAWQLIPTYVTLGMTLLTQSLSTGMEGAKIAWQLAWDQIGLVVQTAWQLIPTYVSLGMTTMQTAVQVGMDTVRTYMDVGWAAIDQATSTAWTVISGAVTAAWATITGDTSAGASTTESTTTSAWSSIESATSAAWTAITTSIASAVQSFVQEVVTGAANVVSEMAALPGKITGAIGNLGSLLVSAGRALMDGLLSGIKAGMNAVLSFARGIAAQIAAVKGPRSYDLRVLRPAGEWLMRGLGDGLARGMDLVRTLVSRFTKEFSALSFAPPNVSLGQFADLGAGIGDSLSAGLAGEKVAIIREAEAIADGIRAQLDRASEPIVAPTFDRPAAALHSEVRRSTAETDADLVGAEVGAGVQITQNFNVPSAERASDKAAHDMRRLNRLGMFGG